MSQTSVHTSIELSQLPIQHNAITKPDSVVVAGHNAPSDTDLQPINSLAAASEIVESPSKGTTTAVLLSVVCITAISTLLSGLMTVGLPTMANDLALGTDLLLWPISVYALSCGCTLLLLGSVADVVGNRFMYLTGCVLQSAFTLACGLAQTGMQLIIFRAFAGIAISFCLPSAVSIITSTFPQGKSRNIAFATMGGGQPIGFSLGLTLGGVFADTIGWRWGFYVAAIINTIITVVAFFGLPQGNASVTNHGVWERLKEDIDWTGAIIAGTSLAMLSYSFATITGTLSHITDPSTLALLIISIALIPLFIFWESRQEKLHRPCIIPNSLWRNRIFTCICLGVFGIWGTFNAVETFLTLFFQDVQEITAIQASIRCLPAPISGALANLVMGLVAHRVRADVAVVFGAVMTSLSALLMAIIQPEWSYWRCAFFAMFLNPVGADTLFTVSNLVITSVFPSKTQAVAGGVFNTVAQVGKSVGMTTSAVIAASVTAHSAKGMGEPTRLMEGYRAAFWYCFAMDGAVVLLFIWGLRGIGRVGIKRE